MNAVFKIHQTNFKFIVSKHLKEKFKVHLLAEKVKNSHAALFGCGMHFGKRRSGAVDFLVNLNTN